MERPPRRTLGWLVSLGMLGAALGTPLTAAYAQSPSASARAPSPAASACEGGGCDGADAPLPDPKTLPPLPPLEPLPKPAITPDATEELARLLARSTSDDEKTREAARAAIGESRDPALVGPLRAKIQELRESLDRDRAPRILEDARKEAREARKKDKKRAKGASGKKGDDEEKDDWLEFVHAVAPRKDDATWRDLVELLTCVRLLGAIGTTPAVRELIELRANFGEMLRVDLQRQITQLGGKAVPALIEARKHDAQIVQRFAANELDKLGRAIPGEAVGTSDPQELADVLRAFGRTRDVDAVRVALSFANHDRRKVRDAAREAVGAIGEPGRWQLRDAFEDLRGEKPPKSASWDDVARWIFWLYDRGRLAELERAVDAGFELQKKGEHAAAVEKFDVVLARDPLAPRRGEMAPSYLALARATPLAKGSERLALLRKALRLEGAAPPRPVIEAEIAFTEAKLLEEQGRPDAFLLRRAIELDPTHEAAKEALAGFETRVVEPPVSELRWAAAAGVGALSLVVAAILGFWGRRRSPKVTSTSTP